MSSGLQAISAVIWPVDCSAWPRVVSAVTTPSCSSEGEGEGARCVSGVRGGDGACPALCPLSSSRFTDSAKVPTLATMDSIMASVSAADGVGLSSPGPWLCPGGGGGGVPLPGVPLPAPWRRLGWGGEGVPVPLPAFWEVAEERGPAIRRLPVAGSGGSGVTSRVASGDEAVGGVCDRQGWEGLQSKLRGGPGMCRGGGEDCWRFRSAAAVGGRVVCC